MPTSSSATAAAPSSPSSDLSDDIVDVPDAPTATPTKSGTKATKRTTTRSTRTAGTTDEAAGTQVEKIWVSVLKVTTTTKDDDNAGLTTNEKVAAFMTKINDYWNAESDGVITVELGGIELRSVGASECVPRDLFASVPVDAFSGRFAKSAWKGTHDHLAMLSLESCDLAGLGTVGNDGGIMFSGNGIGDALGVPVLAHEFGHNLGFGHAGSSVCESTKNVDGQVSDFGAATSLCPTDEYGDYLDIMGYSIQGALPHLSSAQRIHNGYLADYRTISGDSGTSTVTIGRLDGTSRLRALEVIDPVSGEKYYVEYRTASGTDATSSEFTRDPKCVVTDDGYSNCSRTSSTTTGAVRIIRELPYRSNADYVRTTVLAVSDPASKKRNTHLDAGDSFTSADGGFTVAVNSLSVSSGASVSVRLGEAASTETSLEVSAASQTFGSQSRVVATANVNRSNGVVPDGAVAFYSGSTKLASVTLSQDGSASYRLAASLSAGKRAISARFVPASIADVASVSNKKTVTIAQATSTTSITLKKAKVSKKTRAKVAVTVSVSGTTPTGQLSAYASGKKVATYTLSSSKKGKLTITLPKLTSTKSITVKYSGTGNIAAASSGAKKLSVTR